MAPVTRFWIILLFGAALFGLVGHQLSLAPCQEISSTSVVDCTKDNRSGQPVILHTTGCPVHSGYLPAVTAAISLSSPLAQEGVHSDPAKPLLLAFPVLHPPA